MLADFGLIPAFLILAVGFIAATLGLNHVIAPHRPGAVKNSAYECGEPAVGSGWFNYNMRFYAFALAFVVFDIELAVIYPIAVLYRDMVAGAGGLGVLLAILIFAGVLFLGLVVLWVKGDLSWSKELLFTGAGRDVSMRADAYADPEIKERQHATERGA